MLNKAKDTKSPREIPCLQTHGFQLQVARHQEHEPHAHHRRHLQQHPGTGYFSNMTEREIPCLQSRQQQSQAQQVKLLVALPGLLTRTTHPQHTNKSPVHSTFTPQSTTSIRCRRNFQCQGASPKQTSLRLTEKLPARHPQRVAHNCGRHSVHARLCKQK